MTSSFNPLQEPDTLNQFDQNQQLQQQALANIYGEAQKDAQAQVTYTRQQSDANNRAIEALSSFSGQLMEQLVERKKKFNEEEMNQGMLDAFFNGPDETQLASVEEQEQELVSSTRAINTVADKVQEQDGHSLVAQEVRRAGSWREYGKYIGQVQNTVGMLSMQRGFAQANMPVTITDPDGTERQLSYSQLETLPEYQAWQNEFVRKFLTQFPGINPEVAQKYIFPELRKSLKASALEWSNERETRIETERKAEGIDRLVQARGQANIGRVYQQLVESKLYTRKELVDIRRQLQRDGLLSIKDIENIKATELTDFASGRPTTIGKAWERDFADVDAIQQELNQQDYQSRRNQQAQNLERLNNQLARAENLTEAELSALEKELLAVDPDDLENYIPPDEVRSALTAHVSREDRDIEVSKEILNAKWLDRGGYLIEADLIGHPASVRADFMRQGFVKTAEEVSGLTKLNTRYTNLINADVLDTYNTTDGQIPKGKQADFEVRKYRANKAFQEEFLANLRTGAYTPEEAADRARKVVKDKLKEGGYREAPTYSINTQKASVLSSAQTLLKDDPNAHTTQVFPGSEQYLEDLKQFAITRKGRIPQFYHDLAVGSELDAWGYADAQLKAGGFEAGLGRPPAEDEVDKLTPRTQQLLRNYNTPSRTFRAVQNEIGVGGPGATKWFLDTIASKESVSYGEYDAYNLGGANGGYTAFGSGNSAKDGRYGAAVSQLTIGELIALGSSNRIFAAGRYQFIPGTLREVYGILNSQGIVNSETVFNAEIQDLFAMTRAQQRISWPGQNNAQGLINEWRGLKFADPAQLNLMLKILNNEPYLQPQALMPGVTIPTG